MNTFKKNQIIITALAIMIAVAGYLSFTDKSKLDEDQYVFSNDKGEVITVAQDEGALVPNDEDTLKVNTNVVAEDSSDSAATIEDTDLIAEDTSVEKAVDHSTGDTKESLSDNTTAEKDSDAGEAVLVGSYATGSTYFLEQKIKREQTRAERIEILMDLINNTNISDTEKADATSQMVEIQSRVEKEAAAESLLEAKGFSDVFVNMDDKSVDVVVNSQEISDTQLAQITDIVSRKTDMDPSSIRIEPLKTE